MKPIFLASKSPRRRELLQRVGIPFAVIPVNEVVEEHDFDMNFPERYAIELSVRKAKSGIPPENGLVLGFDTIVVHEGQLLEKPVSPEMAKEYLSRLQGSTHNVFTGIAVLDTESGRVETDFEKTEVTFSSMSEEEIEAYISTREPMDKAGAYGIQEKGAFLVREICGDYFNVVGLPLFRLTVVLSKFNIKRLEII